MISTSRMIALAVCLSVFGPGRAALAGLASPGEPKTPETPAGILDSLTHAYASTSRYLRAEVMTRTRSATHTVQIEMWTRGDRGLVRIEAPQREAEMAVLRVGEATYVHDPDWGDVRRVSSDGSRSLLSAVPFRLLDAFVGVPIPEQYEAVGVEDAEERDDAWVLSLREREGTGARCKTLSVIVSSDDLAPIEARCWLRDGGVERWRFVDLHDIAGRRYPARVTIDDPERPNRCLEIDLIDIGVDAVIDPRRFTLTSLSAVE